MIIPKGEVRHQNLLTTYTDFSALLSSLELEGFSGIIEIDFPDNKGAVFIDSGKVINAEARTGGDSKRTIGPEAIQYLLSLSKQKEGVLNIYRLLPEQVAIVASNLQNEILFKDLVAGGDQAQPLIDLAGDRVVLVHVKPQPADLGQPPRFSHRSGSGAMSERTAK